jgi:thiol-disulfide isomerase/thioredoxin
LVNANQPLFRLFRNEMPAVGRTGGLIALRFVGGNKSGAASAQFSCRDGYGARVKADMGDIAITREHRCGDGFAAQHSATMLLGLGSRPAVKSLTVRWPSGRTAETADVPEGSLLTVYENPEDSPSGSAFVRAEYRSERPGRVPPAAERPRFPVALADSGSRARVRVFTTFATWCPSCKKHLPVLRRLHDELADDGVELVAVPVDPEDDDEKVAAYAREWDLPSRLAAIPPADRANAVAAVRAALGEDPPLPSSVVTDADGRVLTAQTGVPSVSALRRMLETVASDEARRTAAGE